MSFIIDNITRRTKRLFESLNEESDDSSILSPRADKSLPDLSTCIPTEEYFMVMKQEISDLKLQLETAHAEVESLSVDNCNLKKQLLEQKCQIETLKKVCSTPGSTKGFVGITSTKKKNKKTKLERKNLIHFTSTPTTSFISTKSKFSDQHPRGNHSIDKIEIPQTQNHDHSENTLPNQSINQEQHTLKKKKMFIIGGQQLTGLASTLIKTRTNKNFECYDIFSFVKPGASSANILNTNEAELAASSSEDKIILCVGEDECNPTKLFIELSTFLKTHSKSIIIVIGIRHNKYLNVTKLNSMMKVVCNNFKNCIFLDTHTILLKTRNYLPSLCRKINLCIDSLYYENNYITLKVRNQGHRISCENSIKLEYRHNTNTLYKKYTIPYFFDRLREKTGISQMAITSQNKGNVTKKKTIPDYFHKINKNIKVLNNENELFRVQLK